MMMVLVVQHTVQHTGGDAENIPFFHTLFFIFCSRETSQLNA
jgi:hypothetical protein